MIYGDLKKEWLDFYHYEVVVCTHTANTFMFKQHLKVNFA